MSLTVLYKSKKVRFAYRFSKSRVMACFVLVFGLSMISSRSTHEMSESVARVDYTRTGIEEQRKEVADLKDSTAAQLTGMKLKLAEVQSQIQRINALGSRLVEQANLNPDEFSFNELPAVGGPINDIDVEMQHQNSILTQIEATLTTLDDKSQQLTALESILLNHHIDEQRYLTGKPIEAGWLSSYYGVRKDPFSGLPAMHKGVDFAGKEGTKVIATAAGVVTWSGQRYGYGNLVEINHGDGLMTRYGHNKQLSVKIGDVVTKGQKIALMGNTGRSTGAHVHYEVIRNGLQQDPLPYVYRKN
jgi:murein DD-endopeptidase MepM/ murein hydrolase activator NlpD